MYNTGKIVLGVLVFLVMFTSPFWYSMATGGSDYYPDPVIATANMPGLDQCVMSADYMRASHMDMLNTWRNDVVRNSDRIYTAPDGRQFLKSLSNTCMTCHYNKVEFCDKCHTYMAVTEPDCWDCHVEPKEGE